MTMDYAAYSQFVLALVFVLALIGILGALARRLGLGGIRAAKGSLERRISIVEVRPLDAKRKVILLRRDHVEHLIVIGPASELLIESGIPVPRPVPRNAFAETLHHAATEFAEGSRR
jgi:flagellar protein FliO/FliZ